MKREKVYKRVLSLYIENTHGVLGCTNIPRAAHVLPKKK